MRLLALQARSEGSPRLLPLPQTTTPNPPRSCLVGILPLPPSGTMSLAQPYFKSLSLHLHHRYRPQPNCFLFHHLPSPPSSLHRVSRGTFLKYKTNHVTHSTAFQIFGDKSKLHHLWNPVHLHDLIFTPPSLLSSATCGFLNMFSLLCLRPEQSSHCS